jgi:hypothetical protein
VLVFKFVFFNAIFLNIYKAKKTKELAISNAKMQVQTAKMFSLPCDCDICWFVVTDAVCLLIRVYDT